MLVILALAALALAVIEGPALGWASPLVMAAASAAAVALALLVAGELRRAEPLVDVRMFGDARFAALSVTAVLVTVLLAGWLFLTTLYLQDVRGEPAVRAGLTILPMPVAMAACAALAGRVLARRGPRVPLAVAGCALAASCAVLAHGAVMGVLDTRTIPDAWCARTVQQVADGGGQAVIAARPSRTGMPSGRRSSAAATRSRSAPSQPPSP